MSDNDIPDEPLPDPGNTGPEQRLDWSTVRIWNLDDQPTLRQKRIGDTPIPVMVAVGAGGSALCLLTALATVVAAAVTSAGGWLVGGGGAVVLAVGFLAVMVASTPYASIERAVVRGTELERLPHRVKVPLEIGLLAIEDIKNSSAYIKGRLGDLDLRAGAWKLTSDAMRCGKVLSSSEQLRAARSSLTTEDTRALEKSHAVAAELLEALDRESAILARAAVEAQRISAQLDSSHDGGRIQLVDATVAAITGTDPTASEPVRAISDAVIARVGGYDELGITDTNHTFNG